MSISENVCYSQEINYKCIPLTNEWQHSQSPLRQGIAISKVSKAHESHTFVTGVIFVHGYGLTVLTMEDIISLASE
jgi:hypothetical protein